MLYSQSIRWSAASQNSAAYEAGLSHAKAALETIRQQRDTEKRPYLTLPGRADDLEVVASRAEAIRASGATDVVVLGTGGSSLGTKALMALKGPALVAAEAPRIHVPDNLGAHLMDAVLNQLDLTSTHFIAVSKSGGTAETVAQLITAYEAVSAKVGADKAADHFTMVTEPGDTLFRRMATEWGLVVLDHDPDLGGRFSVMSVVGALPAMLGGVDMAAVRRGAQTVLAQALSADEADEVPAAAGAVASHLTAESAGCNMAVMLAYESRLEYFMRWWSQLWAESLGKDGKGTTPVAALGPVDQHSQLQLYLDGPHDKFATVVKPVTKGTGPVVSQARAADPKLDYLAGRTIGDLVDAEADATAEALFLRGRPVREITIDRIDEEVIGALMMHYMLETVIAAHLFDVNAFDQPAVEEGKVLTRDALRSGQLAPPQAEAVLSRLTV